MSVPVQVPSRLYDRAQSDLTRARGGPGSSVVDDRPAGAAAGLAAAARRGRLGAFDHLRALEAESIHILREVVAEFERPVMLYSIGKDSSVMLRLAQKAFFPGPIPFPLMHIDTGWKFREMIAFRDRMAKQIGFELIVYTNPRGVAEGINPITHGSAYHTDVMKTEALKQALDIYGFDVAFGGARRDEEKSRAKERIFSFRAPGHRWEPKAQRPELWNLYNTRINPGETIRVFPLSNWTEADVWAYIRQENIAIVPLYFAAKRPVVKRFGQWILDTARAEYDQAWLDYQHEIGLRHHRTKKNRTDSVDAVAAGAAITRPPSAVLCTVSPASNGPHSVVSTPTLLARCSKPRRGTAWTLKVSF